MKLFLFISNSWFSLNQQLIYLSNNITPDTHYVFYIPVYLAHKINNDYIAIINKNTASRITLITYLDFNHGNYHRFQQLDSTRQLDFAHYAQVELHFDLYHDKATESYSSLLIAHHYLQHAIVSQKEMAIHAWDSNVNSLAERKITPDVLIANQQKMATLLREHAFSESFGVLINKGYYLLNRLYPTTYHLVRPDLAAPWFRENLSIAEITLDHSFPLEPFKVYLALLGINGEDVQQLRNTGEIVLLKEPIAWFRYPFPQIADPGLERDLDYARVFGDLLSRIAPTERLTLLAGERDSAENLQALAQALPGQKANASKFTLEALYHLKKKNLTCIAFLGLSAYLLPPEKLRALIVNETPQSPTNYHQQTSDFACPVHYLNESAKLIPNPGEFVVCNTPDPLGDSLFAMACLRTIEETYQKKIAIIGRLFGGESLFQRHPDVYRFIDKQQVSTADSAILYDAFEHGLLLNVLPNAYNNASPAHIIANTLQQLGLPVEPKKLLLPIDIPQANTLIDSLTFSGKTVLLHPNKDAANRCWPQAQWDALADRLLQEGWTVIIIGETKSSFTNAQIMAIDKSGVVNLVNRLKLSETLYLMSKANLLISCDSGPVALAGATDIAIVALYSVVEGERRIPYRHGVLGWNSLPINLSCQYKNCFDRVREESYIRQIQKKVRLTNYISWPYSETCIAAAMGEPVYHCLQSYSAEALYQCITNAVHDGNLKV